MVDIEWAIEASTNNLYILQTRAETVKSNSNKKVITEYKVIKHNNINTLIKGTAISDA